jgi:hypothetical protein
VQNSKLCFFNALELFDRTGCKRTHSGALVAPLLATLGTACFFRASLDYPIPRVSESALECLGDSLGGDVARRASDLKKGRTGTPFEA